MVALFFLLLGGLVLLIAAGRIWMNATPGTVKKTLLANSGREITGSAMTLAPSEVVVLELA